MTEEAKVYTRNPEKVQFDKKDLNNYGLQTRADKLLNHLQSNKSNNVTLNNWNKTTIIDIYRMLAVYQNLVAYFETEDNGIVKYFGSSATNNGIDTRESILEGIKVYQIKEKTPIILNAYDLKATLTRDNTGFKGKLEEIVKLCSVMNYKLSDNTNNDISKFIARILGYEINESNNKLSLSDQIGNIPVQIVGFCDDNTFTFKGLDFNKYATGEMWNKIFPNNIKNVSSLKDSPIKNNNRKYQTAGGEGDRFYLDTDRDKINLYINKCSDFEKLYFRKHLEYISFFIFLKKLVDLNYDLNLALQAVTKLKDSDGGDIGDISVNSIKLPEPILKALNTDLETQKVVIDKIINEFVNSQDEKLVAEIKKILTDKANVIRKQEGGGNPKLTEFKNFLSGIFKNNESLTLEQIYTHLQGLINENSNSKNLKGLQQHMQQLNSSYANSLLEKNTHNINKLESHFFNRNIFNETKKTKVSKRNFKTTKSNKLNKIRELRNSLSNFDNTSTKNLNSQLQNIATVLKKIEFKKDINSQFNDIDSELSTLESTINNTITEIKEQKKKQQLEDKKQVFIKPLQNKIDDLSSQIRNTVAKIAEITKQKDYLSLSDFFSDPSNNAYDNVIKFFQIIGGFINASTNELRIKLLDDNFTDIWNLINNNYINQNLTTENINTTTKIDYNVMNDNSKLCKIFNTSYSTPIANLDIKQLPSELINNGVINVNKLKSLLEPINQQLKNHVPIIREIREVIFKVPAIIVKVIDDYKDYGNEEINTTGNDNYVNTNDNGCVIVGSGCNTDSSELVNYGPFRFVKSPEDNKNPINEDYYNYLINDYELANVLLNEDETDLTQRSLKENVNVKFFGYGFSGSGKTYTLLQGSDEDPSILTYILKWIKTELKKKVKISIDIFYPYEDGDKESGFYQESDTDGKIMKEKIDSQVAKINSVLQGEELENLSNNIKENLEKVEQILKNYLLVLPTTNNPNSSRAFTIVKVHISNTDTATTTANQAQIQFIDLPGLEKKVDMIKDHYYSEKTKENIIAEIKKKEIKPTNTLKGDRRESFFNSILMENNYTALGLNPETDEEKIEKQKQYFEITEDNNNIYITEGADITNTDFNNLLAMIIKTKVLFGHVQLEIKEFKKPTITMTKISFKNLIQKYGFNLLNFINYTSYLKKKYLYNISITNTDITEYINIFKNKFIEENRFKNIDNSGNQVTFDGNIDRDEKAIVFRNTLKTLFYCKFNNNNIKGLPDDTTDSKEINIYIDPSMNGSIPLNKIPEFKSPALTCLNYLLSFTPPDKKIHLLFMIIYTQFTLEQGESIVTSLEHLLFEFLNQLPGGVEMYNNKKDQNERFINVKKIDDKTTYSASSYIIPGEQTVSGMPESVKRKYMKGMNNILNIGPDSRFINLLAIMRRSQTQDGDVVQRRCQGAKETLEFGTTLTQADNSKCGVLSVTNTPLVAISGREDELEKLENTKNRLTQNKLTLEQQKERIKKIENIENITALTETTVNTKQNPTPPSEAAKKTPPPVPAKKKPPLPDVAANSGQGGGSVKLSKRNKKKLHKNGKLSKMKNKKLQYGGDDTETISYGKNLDNIINNENTVITYVQNKILTKKPGNKNAKEKYEYARRQQILETLIKKLYEKTKINNTSSIKTETDQKEARKKAINKLEKMSNEIFSKNKSNNNSVEKDSPMLSEFLTFIKRKDDTLTKFYNGFLKPTKNKIDEIDFNKLTKFLTFTGAEKTINTSQLNGYTEIEQKQSLDNYLTHIRDTLDLPNLKPKGHNKTSNLNGGGNGNGSWKSTKYKDKGYRYYNSQPGNTHSFELDNKQLQKIINKCHDLEILYAAKHFEFMEILKPITYFLDTLSKNMVLYIIILNLYADADQVGAIELETSKFILTAKPFITKLQGFLKDQKSILETISESSVEGNSNFANFNSKKAQNAAKTPAGAKSPAGASATPKNAAPKPGANPAAGNKPGAVTPKKPAGEANTGEAAKKPVEPTYMDPNEFGDKDGAKQLVAAPVAKATPATSVPGDESMYANLSPLQQNSVDTIKQSIQNMIKQNLNRDISKKIKQNKLNELNQNELNELKNLLDEYYNTKKGTKLSRAKNVGKKGIKKNILKILSKSNTASYSNSSLNTESLLGGGSRKRSNKRRQKNRTHKNSKLTKKKKIEKDFKSLKTKKNKN